MATATGIHQLGLGARHENNVVVVPAKSLEFPKNAFAMGAYREDESLIAGTILERSGGTEFGVELPPSLKHDLTSEANVGIDEGIYCGLLWDHFGHFLCESLARVWYALERPDLPLVFIGGSNRAPGGLRPWQTDLLRILQVQNDVMILTKRTRVGVLHIPDLGYRYFDMFTETQRRFLSVYPCDPSAESHTYLSRGHLDTEIGDGNSMSLECRLRDSGWNVVYPEELTINEQLRVLGSSSRIASDEGSALHLAMLLKNPEMIQFDIFRRKGPEHPNMKLMVRTLDLNCVFHSVHDRIITAAKGREVRWLSLSHVDELNILDVPIQSHPFSPVDEMTLRNCRRLAATLPRKSSVLEVGDADCLWGRSGAFVSTTSIARHLGFDPRCVTASNHKVCEGDVLALLGGGALLPNAPYAVVRVVSRGIGEEYDRVMQTLEAVLGCDKRIVLDDHGWLTNIDNGVFSEDEVLLSECESSNLSVKDITSRIWCFTRTDGSVARAPVRLCPDGSLAGYYHKNEASWRLNEGKVEFLREDGKVSTRFDEILVEPAVDGGPPVITMRGSYLWDKSKSIVHVLWSAL